MVVNLASKQEIINRNYNHIYAHEMAHKSAGGVFAGAISIERNAMVSLFLDMCLFRCLF